MELFFAGAHALTAAYQEAIPLKIGYLINLVLILLAYRKLRAVRLGVFESSFYAYCVTTLILYLLAFLRLKLFM